MITPTAPATATPDMDKPIASIFVQNKSNAIEVCLDTSLRCYNEWISKEGGDIGLDRDIDTNRLAGARFPLYAKTLIIGGENFPTFRITLETGHVAIEPHPDQEMVERSLAAFRAGDYKTTAEFVDELRSRSRQPAPDLDKLGTFTFTVSIWEEPRYRTQFIDNRFGRDSVKVYDNGKPMLVSINVEIFPSDEMLPALDRLVAAIDKAGFILDQPKGRGR